VQRIRRARAQNEREAAATFSREEPTMPKKRTERKKTVALPEPIKPVVDMDEVDRRSRELGWTFVDEEDEPVEIVTLAATAEEAQRSCPRQVTSDGDVPPTIEEAGANETPAS
jgi:hypothetical protein